MIFLQGLEKVQVTIQMQSSDAAGIDCNKLEMYKTMTELQLLSVDFTDSALLPKIPNLMLSWLRRCVSSMRPTGWKTET